MGIALVAGCSLIAFGPSLMLWMFVVGKRPALVIIAIVSAFYWLASIALASLLWTMFPPAQGVWILTVTVGVLLQGFGRVALARMYTKTERVINEVKTRAYDRVEDGDTVGGGPSRRCGEEENSERRSLLKLNGLSSSIAAGVGWGAMHAAAVVGTVLAKHTGAGAAFSPSCPRIPSAIISAVSAQAFVWLDLLLMGAVFSYARFGDVRLVSYSFGLHYLAALTTCFNFIDGGCVAALPLLYSVVVLSAIVMRKLGVLTLTFVPRAHTR